MDEKRSRSILIPFITDYSFVSVTQLLVGLLPVYFCSESNKNHRTSIGRKMRLQAIVLDLGKKSWLDSLDFIGTGRCSISCWYRLSNCSRSTCEWFQIFLVKWTSFTELLYYVDNIKQLRTYIFAETIQGNEENISENFSGWMVGCAWMKIRNTCR